MIIFEELIGYPSINVENKDLYLIRRNIGYILIVSDNKFSAYMVLFTLLLNRINIFGIVGVPTIYIKKNH